MTELNKKQLALGAAFEEKAEAAGARVIVDADFWKPETAGDELWGRIVSILPAAPGARVQRPIMRVQTDDGVVVPVGLSALLQSQIPGPAVAVGMRVGILFLGTEDTGKQSAMNLFKVALSDD